MSVNPGLGGQAFMPEAIDRVKKLVQIRTANNLNFKIEIDGGINNETIKLVPDVDIAVAGSYICKSKNYQEALNNLKMVTSQSKCNQQSK